MFAEFLKWNIVLITGIIQDTIHNYFNSITKGCACVLKFLFWILERPNDIWINIRRRYGHAHCVTVNVYENAIGSPSSLHSLSRKYRSVSYERHESISSSTCSALNIIANCFLKPWLETTLLDNSEFKTVSLYCWQHLPVKTYFLRKPQWLSCYCVRPTIHK